MDLEPIYQSIKKELKKVEEVLESSIGKSKNKPVLKLGRFLLESGGKRIRPALVIFSAKASLNQPSHFTRQNVITIASAVELIHMASLIHDDVIDHACLRHNRPTINSKWGQDVSIALGDYLYSSAFKLISTCNNLDILRCISSATEQMCKGELIQVCERNNISLLKQRYYLIVKQKTAALFAACCQSGAMLSDSKVKVQNALKRYGLNFGIAFQIADDCLDLVGEKEDLGKTPGADFSVGELTLPVLNLLSDNKYKNRLIHLLRQKDCQEALRQTREDFINSPAFSKTKQDILTYVQKAKNGLDDLKDSCFKQSLFAIADYIMEKW
ncbi:MAG: polyprenyl synthetase family protein [Candidatus Omnitrophota bacterium]